LTASCCRQRGLSIVSFPQPRSRRFLFRPCGVRGQPPSLYCRSHRWQWPPTRPVEKRFLGTESCALSSRMANRDTITKTHLLKWEPAADRGLDATERIGSTAHGPRPTTFLPGIGDNAGRCLLGSRVMRGLGRPLQAPREAGGRADRTVRGLGAGHQPFPHAHFTPVGSTLWQQRHEPYVCFVVSL
jgi:hypothetical protein